MKRFYIVEKDGKVVSTINKKGRPSRYEEPRYFEDKASAERYMIRHKFISRYGVTYQIEEEEY